MMPAIPALSQARVKDLRALLTTKGRRKQHAFLIEGEKLVREAILAGAPVREVLALPERTAALPALPDAATLTTITPAQADRITDTRAPQGCFAVLTDPTPPVTEALRALPAQGPALAVLLDQVQDPGNVGALIRCAAAFEAGVVVCGPGSADPVHPKVVRAATGSWFHLPIARVGMMAGALAATLDAAEAAGLAAVGADAAGESIYDAADLPERLLLVLGNEGGGFSADVAARLTRRVAVPVAARVESLNVTVAAGILLAELHHRHMGGR